MLLLRHESNDVVGATLKVDFLTHLITPIFVHALQCSFIVQVVLVTSGLEQMMRFISVLRQILEKIGYDPLVTLHMNDFGHHLGNYNRDSNIG